MLKLKTQSLLLSIIFSMIIALSACSNTSIRETWQAETFHKKDFSNVLVVAMTPNKTSRLLFENEFNRVLSDHGINAKPSWQAIGDSPPTKKNVQAYLASGKADYVLATKVGDLKVEKDYVPPSAVTYYTGPFYPTYNHFWDSGSSFTMTREGYTDTRTTLVLITSIYDAKTQELVWVGYSETFEAASISNLADELAEKTLSHINK